MRYSDAEITLVEAKELSQDILLNIRNWHNDENISKFMYGNHKISKDEHLRWLSSLPTRNNLRFFVVLKNENPIDMVQFNNISY